MSKIIKLSKVAIFFHGLGGGAFTNLATSLARGFKELGIDCDLVVLNASDEEKARYPDLNIVVLNARRAILSSAALTQYFREQKPDVVFPMPWYFNVIAIWARFFAQTPTKVIITEHNIVSLEAKIEHSNNLRMRYLPILMRYTYPYGDGLIAVCRDTIADLVNQVKVSARIPMTVIHNPIDIERIQKLAAEPIEDCPWLSNREFPVILTVARLAKQKQLDVLIRAFARVVKVLPAKLVILGEGSLRAELESLCRELKVEQHVAMPGYKSNPYKFMSSCDVFVLASAFEGCPIALEEALACGAAVIVNDAPGGSKDVIEYGKYGMIVPAKDDNALAESIVHVLTEANLKSHYQKQAQSRALDFHYLSICQQYLDFSESVSASNQEEVIYV